MNENKNWEEFIHKNLLKDGFIDGFLLFSLDLELVYQYGKLSKINQSEFTKFKDVFDHVYDESSRATLLQRVLYLNVGELDDVKFVIRQLQNNCISCVTKHNRIGVVIVKFQFGIIVASHSYPIPSHVALNQIQDLVVMLCS